MGTERGREAREGIEEERQLTEEREGEKVERTLREGREREEGGERGVCVRV